MLAAFTEAARALGRDDYREVAERVVPLSSVVRGYDGCQQFFSSPNVIT
jgi:hypothetical protein